MKPTTPVAMRDLIGNIRQAFPFDSPQSTLCNGPCEGCSKKLLEFLDDRLTDWEVRLNAGDIPTLGDVNSLARQSKKIHTVLKKNRLL